MEDCQEDQQIFPIIDPEEWKGNTFLQLKKIALLNRITIVSLNKRQIGPLKRKSRRLLKRKSIELLKEDKSMFLIEYQSVFPIIKPKGFLNRNPISIHNRRTKGLFCGIPASFPNESTNVPLNRILIDFFSIEDSYFFEILNQYGFLKRLKWVLFKRKPIKINEPSQFNTNGGKPEDLLNRILLALGEEYR